MDALCTDRAPLGDGRAQSAAYKVPRIIEFLGKVPKIASGKTQRFALGQREG